jgi:hypothetical protein
MKRGGQTWTDLARSSRRDSERGEGFEFGYQGVI